MDTKTRVLFVGFASVIFVATFFSYQRYFLHQNFLITAEIPCDPSVEICFVYRCDPAEGEGCGEDVKYIKKIEGIASTFPSCDPNNSDCTLNDCGNNLDGCRVLSCDSLFGECSSPEMYEESLSGKVDDRTE